MDDDAPPPEGIDALEQLHVTLAAALNLATELTKDSLLQRLLSVYRAMPTDDRPVIISVLEREVLGRHLARGTEGPVGGATFVNPNARLYVRSLDSDFDRRAVDLESMIVADVRALRIATIIRNVPGIHEMFKEALSQALTQVDPDTWTVAEDLLNDALACIAQARSAVRPLDDPPVPQGEPPDSPDPTADAEAAQTGATKPTRRS
jgi:hypothetical protein